MPKSLIASMLVCLVVPVAGACVTEVESLTDTPTVSKQLLPGMGGVWLTNRIGGPGNGPASTTYDVYLDGEPALNANGQPLRINSSSSLVTSYMKAGTFAVGLAVDGQVVVETQVVIAPNQYNYLVAHGPVDNPELLVVSDDVSEQPADGRRVRVISLRPDHEDVTFAFLDEDDQPLADTAVTLSYGEVWSGIVSNSLQRFGVQMASGFYGIHEFDCNPMVTFFIGSDHPGQANAQHGLVPDDPTNMCPEGTCACPCQEDVPGAPARAPAGEPGPTPPLR